MIGTRFGRLTVLGIERVGGRDYYECACDCGGRKRVYGSNARLGKTTSCGCVQKARAAEANTVHGLCGSIEHSIWSNIKKRCLNPDDPAFKDYGARGISICAEWRDDFTAFLAAVGPRPSPDHSIDRLDNSKGYEPGNVHWATPTEQARNRRSNRVVVYQGRKMPVAEAIEASGTGTPRPTIYHRLHRGWPIERALA